MKRFGIIAAALLASACIPDKITNTDKATQNPSTPTGTVIGVVTSAVTGAGISGVTVSVQTSAGTFSTATTSSTGSYSVGNIPAGATYNVKFALTGYVTNLASATIPDDAGLYPANGVVTVNSTLAPNTGSIFGVVRATNAQPAAGVVIGVNMQNQGYDYVMTATTDSSGAYTFTGLPARPSGVSVTLLTAPWDVDSDGIVDFNTFQTSANSYPGVDTQLDFSILGSAVSLQDLTNNMVSGKLANTSSLEVTFNRELDMNKTQAWLWDSTTSAQVAVNLSVDATGTILTIAPNDGVLLAPYHWYELEVDGYAPNGSYHYVYTSFQAVDPNVTLLGPVLNVEVTPLANAVNYNTRNFSLTWDMIPAASSYQVWARDNHNNPAWVRVATGSQSFSPGASLTLPYSFDYYSWDGEYTPFLWGTDVEFAVVAVNAAGEAPLPDTATAVVTRSDTVVPTATLLLSGFLDNRGNSAARTVTLTATFTEFMDIASVPATPLSVPTGVTYTYDWSANTKVLTYTITVPAQTNGAGTYTVAGWKDTSGNVMTSTSVQELVVNGSMEANSATLTSWTTAFTGTTTAPAPVTGGYSGTYGARLGNTGTTTAQSGTSSMYQNVSLPVNAKSITISAAYRYYSSYYYSYDYVGCSIYDSTGVTWYGDLFWAYTYGSQTNFATPSVSATGLSGNAIRVYCYATQGGAYASGMTLDNVSVLVYQ